MAEAPQRQGSFWTSLTGMITALAAFIAAAATVLGILAAAHTWPFADSHENPTASTSSEAPAGVLDASPSRYSFGDVQVGQASPAKVVTVTNLRKTPATVSTGISSTDSGDFQIVLDTCSDAPLAPNAKCQLELVFSPKTQGQKVAKLALSSPGGEVPAPIALDGNGLPPGALSFDPTSIFIGLFSTTSKPAPPNRAVPLKIINSGGGQLKISIVKADDPEHFTVSVSCHGKTLAPGGSCSLTVTFAASENKTFKAKVLVYDDAPGSPHAVALTGYRGPLLIHFP